MRADTHNGEVQRLAIRDPEAASSESELDQETLHDHAGNIEMLRDGALYGVPLADALLLAERCPSSARQEQANQYIRSWLHYLSECNRNTLCPTTLPWQIRELHRATSSRAARKAIKLRYKLNAAQWKILLEEWTYYIVNQNDEPLTVDQLDMLDIYANSRTARSLLRRRGPVDKMFHRTLQRQLAAHMSDIFGTKQTHPTTPAILARQDRNKRRHARVAAKVKQALSKYRHGSLHYFLTAAISGTPRRRTPQIQPDEYMALEVESMYELDWAERGWLRLAMDDFHTIMTNTTAPRTGYEQYIRSLKNIGDEQHEISLTLKRRRAHSVILTTLWALLGEMKRVNGWMLQHAQETL